MREEKLCMRVCVYEREIERENKSLSVAERGTERWRMSEEERGKEEQRKERRSRVKGRE